MLIGRRLIVVKCKKYIAFIILFCIVALVLIGCEKEKDFIDVSSVTFTSAGETKTLYSTWYIQTGSYKTATESEYRNSKFKTSVLAPSDVTINTIAFYTTDLFSGNIYNIKEKPYKPYNISTDDIGEYLYIYAHDLGAYTESYYKVEIIGVGAIYRQVKIVNDSTIVIKTGKLETTYTVTSYSLRK